MQFNKIVENLKQGQSGVVDFKIKNNPNILTAASLEKAKENDISFLENNSPLNLRNLIKTSKASALLLPANDDYIVEMKNKIFSVCMRIFSENWCVRSKKIWERIIR